MNPNTAEVTADALLKVFIEVNRPKADAAIRKALQEPDAPQEAPQEQRPSVRQELRELRAAAAALPLPDDVGLAIDVDAVGLL